MTFKDFRELQARIGCTNRRLATWMGLTPNAISRYRNGDRPVPGPVAMGMKALAEGWRP